ncbi:TPA: sugar phosphate isomerase/epimerase [bacterium]|nr:sugar phosphate isomerase/epimerase [bacterium]
MEFAICYSNLDQPHVTTNMLQENGITLIESFADFFLNNDDDKIIQTAKLFLSKGINIRSVHAPFDSNYSLSNFDDAKRQKAIQIHEELLYKTALANVEMIIIHPGDHTNSKENIELMIELAIDSISQLIGTSEETGVRLAVENMPPDCPGAEVDDIVKILESIDSISLGMCFDVGHSNITNNMIDFINVVGNSIITIHLHDNDGTYDMHLQPPYGTTNWRDFAEMIMDTGYAEPFTIESAPWGGASFRQMVKETSAVIEGALNSEELQSGNSNIGLRCLKCGHAILRSEGQWFCNCTYDV